MTLAPLLQASPVIQIHAFAAIGAFVLGSFQLMAPKGTISHRKMGWAWASLMMIVAISSLFIHTIRTFGPFSLIHLLSILVLVQVPYAIWAVRSGRISAHKKSMTLMFVFALVVAGFFTFVPGRIMHDVLFGG